MKRLLIYLGLLSSVALTAAPSGTTKDYSYSQAQKGSEQDKWPMYLELEGKKGNFRDILRLSWLVPLWQDDDNMLFGDVRLMMDDRSDREANIALGYRHIVRDWDMGSDGVILGAYVSYDRRKSTLGNKYNQGTIGVEALGEYFRFSANYYAPQNKKHHVSSSFNPSVLRSGWNVVNNELVFTYNTLLNPTTSEEVTLKGYDAELRGKLPVTEDFNVWGGIGAYKFSRAGVKRDGPMAMVDVELLDALGIEGSRAALGFEYRKDKGEKATRYGVLKLTTPLASVGQGQSYPSLTGVEYEMTRFILRDVDIQTGISTRADTPTLASGTTGTAVSGDTTTTVDLHAGSGITAAHIGTDNKLSGLASAMLAMVRRDVDDTTGGLNEMVIFLGVDSNENGGVLSLGVDDLKNARRLISGEMSASEAKGLGITDDEIAFFSLNRATPEEMTRLNVNQFGHADGTDVFVVGEYTVVLGAASHGMDPKTKITDDAVAGSFETLGNNLGFSSDDSTNFYNALQAALQAVDENTPILVHSDKADDPTEFIVDGAIYFSADKGDTAAIAVENMKVTSHANVGPDGNMQPGLINVSETSLENVAAVQVAIDNAENTTTSITGDMVLADNPLAGLAILAKMEASAAEAQDLSTVNLDKANIIAFKNDGDANNVNSAITTYGNAIGGNPLGLSVAKIAATANDTLPLFVDALNSNTQPAVFIMEDFGAYNTQATSAPENARFIVAGMDNLNGTPLGGGANTVTVGIDDIVSQAASGNVDTGKTPGVSNDSPAAAAAALFTIKGAGLGDVTEQVVSNFLGGVESDPNSGAISLSKLSGNQDFVAATTAAINADNYDAAIEAVKGNLSVATATPEVLQASMAMVLTSQGSDSAVAKLHSIASGGDEGAANLNVAVEAVLSDPKAEAAVTSAVTEFITEADPTSDAYTGVMKKVTARVPENSSYKPVFDNLSGNSGSKDDQLVASDLVADLLATTDLIGELVSDSPSDTVDLIAAVFTPQSQSGSGDLQKGQNNALAAILSVDMSDNTDGQSAMAQLLKDMFGGGSNAGAGTGPGTGNGQ